MAAYLCMSGMKFGVGMNVNNVENSAWNSMNYGKSRTLTPISTGTSVIAMEFEGGVVIAADTLASYGSTARFRDCERLMKVNDNIIIGASGDYADFQFIRSVIEDKIIEEESYHDGFNLKPKSLLNWLTRVLYNRRSKFDPLWNTVVVGGLQDGEPFLGQVDMIGTSFEAPTVATGLGLHMAQPILRGYFEERGRGSKQEAKDKIQECMTTLFYRDARAFHSYHLGVVTAEGADIEGPLKVNPNWEIASFKRLN
ncbi:proteasome subunit beta type-4-like [Centruroides sculpturatus]|uniref:proteasome subunit beta type-4-like n=1 Tax=Centruroides sculpturatus TaxID=218467 RepID=UPI000C6E2137|nr:proteasome subunit beta type-4-like [Centruroides sculpturatus]